jgi:hypothetical protein
MLRNRVDINVYICFARLIQADYNNLYRIDGHPDCKDGRHINRSKEQETKSVTTAVDNSIHHGGLPKLQL